MSLVRYHRYRETNTIHFELRIIPPADRILVVVVAALAAPICRKPFALSGGRCRRPGDRYGNTLVEFGILPRDRLD